MPTCAAYLRNDDYCIYRLIGVYGGGARLLIVGHLTLEIGSSSPLRQVEGAGGMSVRNNEEHTLASTHRITYPCDIAINGHRNDGTLTEEERKTMEGIVATEGVARRMNCLVPKIHPLALGRKMERGHTVCLCNDLCENVTTNLMAPLCR